MPPHRPTTMLRAAVRPRMLVILVVLLAAAAVCARLGAWQLDRAQARAEAAAAGSAQVTAAPVPLEDVIAPQTSFTADLVGRPVTVAGTYEADGQLVVRDRALDGRDGFLVLTPLRVGTGDAASRPVLPVVRGWVASAGEAGAPPDGEVQLTGHLQASEAAGALDAAAGQVESVSSAQLVNLWGGPIYSGYLVVTEASPAQGAAITALPPPEPRGGSGWDLRNLGYALQWWIFGLFAVVLWLRLVRDEARGEPAPGEVPVVVAPASGDAVVAPASGDAVVAPASTNASADERPAVTSGGGDAAP